MPSSALIFEIIGVDKASHAFEKVGHSTSKVEGNLKKLKVAGGLAFAALAVGAVELAKKSVEKFQETGVEAIRLQRIMGGTAEQVSRLNFAAEETGLSSDTLAMGVKFLAKFTQKASDQFAVYNDKVVAAAKAHKTAAIGVGINVKALQKLGVAFQDANGKVLPTAQLLPQVAEAFKEMPAGAQKTALAVQIFGRNGTAMLPFLNKGAEGLKEFGIESDKLGHTLSGAQLDAIKKNIAAHRQFKAALSGVEIQIGAALYPALTKIIPAVSQFAASLAEKLIPKLREFGHWLSDKVGPALSVAYQRILPGVQRAFASVSSQLGSGAGGWQQVGNAVLKFIDIASRVTAVVLPLMIRLWGTQIKSYQVAYQAISKFGSISKTVFAAVVTTFLNMVGLVVDGAARAFGWVPGLGGKLKKAAASFDAFRDKINNALNGIHDKTVNVKVVASINGSKLSNQAKSKALDIAFRASGGPVRAGSPYVVGEEGPELFVPGQSGGIVPNGKSARNGAGASSDFTASAPLVIQLDSGAIWQGLVTMKRRRGITSLGLT